MIIGLAFAFSGMSSSVVRSSGSGLFQGTGTVIYAKGSEISDCYYFIRTDDNRCFEPMNLRSSFNVDGLRIQFTADLTGEFTMHGMEAVTLNSASLLGDVDGDLKVSFIDAYWLEQAFGSQPSSFRWNPAADLNYDGVVNILDALLLSDNYGARVEQFRFDLRLFFPFTASPTSATSPILKGRRLERPSPIHQLILRRASC